jgi:hypothetical protein
MTQILGRRALLLASVALVGVVFAGCAKTDGVEAGKNDTPELKEQRQQKSGDGE